MIRQVIAMKFFVALLYLAIAAVPALTLPIEDPVSEGEGDLSLQDKREACDRLDSINSRESTYRFAIDERGVPLEVEDCDPDPVPRSRDSGMDKREPGGRGGSLDKRKPGRGGGLDKREPGGRGGSLDKREPGGRSGDLDERELGGRGGGLDKREPGGRGGSMDKREPGSRGGV